MTSKFAELLQPWIDAELEPDSWEDEVFVAVLLAEQVIFLNTNWHRDDWPEEAQKSARLIVDCSDVFAWGVAEGHEIYQGQFRDLWAHWTKDPDWGAAVWCMKQRKRRPQAPVEDRIRKAGIWDLDEVFASFEKPNAASES